MVQLSQQFLSPLEFRFFIKRMPKTNFFVQACSLPSMTLSVINQPSPFGQTLYRTGHQLTYGEIDVRFKVDEDMNNYRELLDWLVGLGFPREFPEYKNLLESDDGLYSDGTLMIMSSQKNPSIRYTFYNMFPTSLSGIELDTTTEDVLYADCTVSFRYDTFKIDRIRDD